MPKLETAKLAEKMKATPAEIEKYADSIVPQMLNYDAVYLASIGFCNRKQLKIQGDSKAGVIHVVFSAPFKKTMLPIKFDINLFDLINASSVISSSPQRAYCLFRMIVSSIGRDIQYAPTILKHEAEEDERRAYFKDLWYLASYVDQALKLDNFSQEDLYIKPLNKSIILKTIDFIKHHLSFTDEKLKILDKLCNLSASSLAILYQASNEPVVEPKIMLPSILSYFASADKSTGFDFMFERLKPVPIGLVRSLIVPVQHKQIVKED